jgi:hypothetical protein
MHALRHLSVLALVLVAANCSDATAPRHASESYYLVSIDGQAVPTVTVSIPGTLTITTVWGSLALNANGSAVVVTHEIREDESIGTSEHDRIESLEYRIHGDSIEVGTFGTCHAFCLPNLEGTITESTVILTPKGAFHGPPVYLYSVTHEAPI